MNYISMFTQLYCLRYTQPIKAYNYTTIHLLMVKDHLYHNIHILCLILKHSNMNLAMDLTYSFDINTVSLKSSSL